ncbi:MAG: STAS domain-containing protein [Patescibacteria group bacterium]
MRIVLRYVRGVTVLDLHGKIAIGEGDEALRDTVSQLVGDGKTKIVLNLDDVPYVDSMGLAVIVRCYMDASRQYGKLKLLKITKKIEDLLTITKLRSVFEIYDTEEEAVASFGA